MWWISCKHTIKKITNNWSDCLQNWLNNDKWCIVLLSILRSNFCFISTKFIQQGNSDCASNASNCAYFPIQKTIDCIIVQCLRVIDSVITHIHINDSIYHFVNIWLHLFAFHISIGAQVRSCLLSIRRLNIISETLIWLLLTVPYQTDCTQHLSERISDKLSQISRLISQLKRLKKN